MEISEKDLAKKIKEAVEAETVGLKNKRDELLGKLKKATEGSTVDATEHAQLQSDHDDLVNKLAKQDIDHKKEVETLTGQVTTKDKGLNKLLVETGLNDALLGIGVAKELLPGAKAILSGEFTVEADGEGFKAMAGDKSLADRVKEFSESDEGKHYLAADASGGGGSNGGEGGKSTVEDDGSLHGASRMRAAREAQQAK